MTPLLEFVDVRKTFGSRVALDGVRLTLPENALMAVLGPNGAGKSTLISCALGLVRPNSGRIQFEGRPLKPADGARFGYLCDRVAMSPHRTVHENGLFYARLKDCAGDWERQLDRVGLRACSKLPVRQLSKGLLQRLGLAVALCGSPRLLFLDEPFNGLDPDWLARLQQILREEFARGASILVATHTLSAVAPLATHAAIMRQGQVVRSESARCFARGSDSWDDAYASALRRATCADIPDLLEEAAA